MSSFKLYLPSNACPKIYPNNTPTDFRINLDKPIQLEGKWEVGVESIYYSSNIYDSAETATMNVTVEHLTRPYVNDNRSIRYRVSENKKWLGFDGMKPSSFQPDPSAIDNILAHINKVNEEMTIGGVAFKFYRVRDTVVCEIFDDGLFLCLSPNLAKAIGMNQVIGGSETIVPYKPDGTMFIGNNRVVYSDHSSNLPRLTWEDYRIRFIHTGLQVKNTFTLKWPDLTPPVEATITNSWKKSIPYDMDLTMKFAHSLISNQHANLAIDLSPRMRQTLGQPFPIIGANSSQGSKPCTQIDVYDIKNGYWYVDVYGTDMTKFKRSTFKTHVITLLPWRSNSIRQLLSSLKAKVEMKLRTQLRRIYHKNRHHFSIHLEPSYHVIMKLGKRLQVSFSPNLAFLLGFHEQEYKGYCVTSSQRQVDTLFNRSRQLHILSNIVQPTVVGNKQVQILRDFIHRRTRKTLRVKHFDAISYVPLMFNYIDKLHMQLVNDRLEAVRLQDTKTIITLYFRKI